MFREQVHCFSQSEIGVPGITGVEIPQKIPTGGAADFVHGVINTVVPGKQCAHIGNWFQALYMGIGAHL